MIPSYTLVYKIGIEKYLKVFARFESIIRMYYDKNIQETAILDTFR